MHQARIRAATVYIYIYTYIYIYVCTTAFLSLAGRKEATTTVYAGTPLVYLPARATWLVSEYATSLRLSFALPAVCIHICIHTCIHAHMQLYNYR